jgi:pimeloyl-ACP methyl ester carboxylesterase
MTGYNSCGPQGDPATGVIESSQVASLVADYQARYHTPLVYVESCYNGYSSSSIDFRTNVDDSVRSTGWQDGDALVEALRGLGKGGARLVLVGHSYGGWTAMRVAAKLAAEGRAVDLVTIDPISPARCTQIDFLRGALATSGSQGCTTGPKDADDALLSHRLASWRNFYQTSDPLVHSASIPGAQNTLIEIPPGTQARAHDAIPHDDRPWTAVRSLLGLD